MPKSAPSPAGWWKTPLKRAVMFLYNRCFLSGATTKSLFKRFNLKKY